MVAAAGLASFGLQAAGAMYGAYQSRKTMEANRETLRKQKQEMRMARIIESLDAADETAKWMASAKAQVAASGLEMSGSIQDAVIAASMELAVNESREELNLQREMKAVDDQIKSIEKEHKAKVIGSLFSIGSSAVSMAGR